MAAKSHDDKDDYAPSASPTFMKDDHHALHNKHSSLMMMSGKPWLREEKPGVMVFEAQACH